MEEAAESRRREMQTTERLAIEAAEVKTKLGDTGGKQRDVSHSTPVVPATGVFQKLGLGQIVVRNEV